MSGVKTAEELMDLFVSEYTKRRDDPGRYKGWRTGLADLDNPETLGGVFEGWYVVVSGKRKSGKTAFLTSLRRSLGFQGVSFLTVSLEEGDLQMAERQVSNLASIDRRYFRDVDLSEEQWRDVLDAAGQIAKFRGFWDSGLVTVASIAEVAKQLDVDVIMVDYIQLLTPSDGGGNRTQEVSQISRALKLLTLTDRHYAVVANAQLNDDGDYLWSRDIGRDTDVAIRLSRIIDPYGQAINDRLKMEIVDSRHSAPAEFQIMFNGARSLVGSLVDINKLLEEREKQQ